MSAVTTRASVNDIRTNTETIIDLIDALARAEVVGNVFYVSTSGSDSNTGKSWSTAFRTLIYAISQVTSGNGDVIYMAPGDYDETANGSSGVIVDVDELIIQGVGDGVHILNSNTDNNGGVFYVTGNHVRIGHLCIIKGETTATGTVLITFDGATEPFLLNCHIYIHTADVTGLKMTGGTTSAFIGGLGNDESRIHGDVALVRVGIGIDFDDCTFCTTDFIQLENLLTAAVFRADGDANVMLPSTVIADCTTGISLEPGALNNSLLCPVTACTTEYFDLSGNATNDRDESITSIREDLGHVPKFTGRIWFVSEDHGLDTNSGRSPDEAFATIGNALNNVAEGDAVTIEAGDYYETGLDVNLIGTEIWGEIGARIYNTTGIALTVSARDCRVNEVILHGNGQTALLVSGNNCMLQNITIPASGIGCSVTGEGNRLKDIIINNPTTTGLDISGAFNACHNVIVSNPNVATRGFYLSGAGADQNTLVRCSSIGNTIAGFEVVAGANYNMFVNCTSGGGDGIRIDAGTNTVWAFFHPESHSPQFTGNIWYVSGNNGSDTNSGQTPDEPFATISHALDNVAAGDAIIIEAADYHETGLDLNLIGLELWGEIGVRIYNNTGTALTLSARDCRINEIKLVATGQIAILVSGDSCKLQDITVPDSAIGCSITGEGNRLRDIIIIEPTTTGLDISGAFNDIHDVVVSNALVAARGFYLSGAGADQNSFERCHSIGNTIAGFEVVADANYNSFIECTSAGGDGKRIDSGDFNFWDIIEELTTEHHELMLPMSDGEGTAGAPVLVDNLATDDTPDSRSDLNYWGDTMVIISPSFLATWWNSLGIYIFALTAGKDLQWQIWFPDGRVNSARNAGNAWDLGETILTVTDGTLFLVNDYVWVRSDSHPNGEILIITNIAGNVITVASETRFSGNTGVRYNHVGNEAMYLIYRPTDDRYSGFNGGYAAASAKDFYRIMWHEQKEVAANSAMIIRTLNTADNLDTEFEVNALYSM